MASASSRASAARLPSTTRALARQWRADARIKLAPSYHDGRPPHTFEGGLAQAFDTRVNLVGRTEVEDEHMVLARLDDLLEPARHFRSPLRRKPALKHRELQPAAVAVHQPEHAPPTLVAGNVIRHDVQPLVDH